MVIPCISFDGHCKEAIDFYSEIFEVNVITIDYFEDSAEEFRSVHNLVSDFVMNSEVVIDGQKLMMTDGATAHPTSDYFSFCVTKETEEEVKKIFRKLSKGGRVIEELEKVFWSTLYGIVEDKFGYAWMVMVS